MPHHEPEPELADGSALRLAIQARPPVLIHGTFFGAVLLLGAALLWSAMTRADLVVRAPGRVRPVTSPTRVVYSSTAASGRVVAVHGHEGAYVRQGEVLIQLDTERLDNDIARQQRVRQAGEEELAQLYAQTALLERQWSAARAKHEAELAQAQAEVHQAQERWVADQQVAALALHNAVHEATQTRRLMERGIVAQDVLRKATTQVQEAQEKLRKANLPVESGKLAVLRRALDLTEHEYALRRQDLQTRQSLKQNDLAALRLALANVQLERQQASMRAPIDGLVITGDVKMGDVLEPGKPAIEIAAQQGFRFEMTVPSAEMGRLQVGLPARVKLDAYDYQRYGTVAGTVVFIAPDSGLPLGQPVATYLVKIHLTDDELALGPVRGEIKLGMTGQAEIVTAQERLLTLLLKKLRQTISLG